MVTKLASIALLTLALIGFVAGTARARDIEVQAPYSQGGVEEQRDIEVQAPDAVEGL